MKKEVIYRTSDGREFKSEAKADRHIEIMKVLDSGALYAPAVYKILINSDLELSPTIIKLLLVAAKLGAERWAGWELEDEARKRRHDAAISLDAIRSGE